MKYCKKHDREYMEHLNRCPLCAGEELKFNWMKKKIILEKEDKKNE